MSASDGERSPKRQRLDSYSPASPLPSAEPTKAFIPNTPPPSVRMSPSWTATQTNQQHQPGGSNFPSPPSTVGFQNRNPGRGSEASGDSGRQTPASPDDGEVRRDGDGDSEMKDRMADAGGDISMADAEHRKTNHERLGGGGDVAAVPLYKLSTAPILPSRPHPSQSMIELYGLQRIQAKVARRDPVTGEKINVMRKSYANKVKALGLEGRNKAMANEGDLQGLLDPLWDNMVDADLTLWQQKWAERRLDDSNALRDVFSKMDAALKMEPGRLPNKEHNEWKHVLGLDDAPAVAKAPAATNAAKPSFPANPQLAKTSAASAIRRSAPASPQGVARPDRANKKRSYQDNSFEGYEDDGYSTGGVDDTGRRRDPKRQKRKVSEKTNGYYDISV